MKGVINICTVKERVNDVLNIVGETLIGVSESFGEALIQISATEEEWQKIKLLLLSR